VSSPHVVFPALMNCVKIMVVVGAEKMKRWTNVSLNHCQALLKCTLLMKLKSVFHMHSIPSMMNGHYELGIGAVLSETQGFK
jgi:hypothetical protein